MVKVRAANLNLRVDPDAKARWETQAKAEKRSLTNLIEFVLDEYVHSQDRKEARRARKSK